MDQEDQPNARNPRLVRERHLLKQTIDDFDEFNLDGHSCICKVLRIHDADTMTIGFQLSNRFYKKNIRLDGVDAPELHSKNADESKLCRLGREYLKTRYQDTLIRVEMDEMDKYGRILAKCYDLDTDQSINNTLIEYKFVRPYGGNLHKDDWDLAFINEGIQIAGGLGIEDPGK